MRAIVVDDELSMLETLEEAVAMSNDIEKIESFSSCSAALAYAETNEIDIAFLDINMRGIGGLALAEKIVTIQPKCKVVFCTGHEEYAVDAFRLHVSGYLMKPIMASAVQKEIDHIKGVKATEKLLNIKCFGNFEAFHDGNVLPFKRKKTKELLAILVDRNGSGMTAKQLCTVLFPDDLHDARNAGYLRQLVLDLKTTLKAVGASEVFCHNSPYYRIDTEKIRCDYFSYLKEGKPDFYGEYMSQYSWAEETCGMLLTR